jgi:hypothetical protein
LRTVRGRIVMTHVSTGSGVKMPGTIVGMDGSAHSQSALEWAIDEAGGERASIEHSVCFAGRT